MENERNAIMTIYETARDELTALMRKNHLEATFNATVSPMTLTVRPSQNMDDQQEMLEAAELDAFNSPDASLTLINDPGGEDRGCYAGRWTLDKKLQDKIYKAFRAMAIAYAYLTHERIALDRPELLPRPWRDNHDF